MRLALRMGAIVIAIAAFVDPAIARRVAAPVSIAFQLPRPSDPGYSSALEARARVAASLDDRIIVDGAQDPAAIVALGNAEPNRFTSAPVFVVAPPTTPAVRVDTITVPRPLVTGQAASVQIALQGSKVSGRKSSIVLHVGGAPLHSVEHEWTSDDERFDTTVTVPLTAAGVHRVRAAVSTDGIEPTVADAVVVLRDRPLRVLAYEPRPSWPVAFVRRSIEGDAIFSLSATSRNSRPVATTSGKAPRSLTTLDPEAFDALILGGLDELSGAEWRVAEQFVSVRGGTLLLLPDRQVPESVRRRFDLQVLEEVLLDNPVDVGDGSGLKGSEFLLMRPNARGFRTLGSVGQGDQARAAVIAAPSGAGTVVFSGALDAWRYRGAGQGQFDRFWQGLLADAARAAVPKIDVALEPAIARPGDPILVRATVRPSEFAAGAEDRSVGPIEVALIREDGAREPLRLWPGANVGTFASTVPAPAPGRHVVQVRLSQTSTDVPLLVADDVVYPTRDTSRAWRHAAEASGGAVVQNAEELNAALMNIDAGSMDQTTRPMRSPWWIVPFSLLLSLEWALRRRSGLT